MEQQSHSSCFSQVHLILHLPDKRIFKLTCDPASFIKVRVIHKSARIKKSLIMKSFLKIGNLAELSTSKNILRFRILGSRFLPLISHTNVIY